MTPPHLDDSAEARFCTYVGEIREGRDIIFRAEPPAGTALALAYAWREVNGTSALRTLGHMYPWIATAIDSIAEYELIARKQPAVSKIDDKLYGQCKPKGIRVALNVYADLGYDVRDDYDYEGTHEKLYETTLGNIPLKVDWTLAFDGIELDY